MPDPIADREFMTLALRRACRGWGRTSPNPMVGALVVRGNRVVGRGFHAYAGGPHAERIALEEAGDAARGATLYVTLEPCNHFGKTAPCTEAVLKSGIRRVVIGQKDPNPRVRGGGAKRLMDAGIQVDCGILDSECAHLNEAFTVFVTRNRPFVALKTAATLDGKTATAIGDSQWITNERSRRFVHRLRAASDAILVGMGTIRADDPRLTCRYSPGRDPLRVILDSRLTLSPDRRVFNKESRAGLLICTCQGADSERKRLMERVGAEVLEVEERNGRVSLSAVMRELAARDITSVLIEGGAEVSASAIGEGVVDKVYFFYAPKILGGPDAPGMVGDLGIRRIDGCLNVRGLRVRRFGEDVLLEGYLGAP